MNGITNFKDKCIIVKIPIGTHCRKNIYEATRRCWRLDLIRARKAEYLLGIIDGVVKCVIKVKNCGYLEEEFCNKEENNCKKYFNVDVKLCKKSRRIAFVGEEIKFDKKYLCKKIPDEYLMKRNPVRYTYK